MIDGEEYHTFEEKPVRYTEKGLEELLKGLPPIVDVNSFDALIYGRELFHLTGNYIRQISVMSKEGQELLNRLDEEGL